MNSNYIPCKIVEKHGEDDFSLWAVDIRESDYKAAMEDFVRLSGSPAEILNSLPLAESMPETSKHFMYSNSNRSEIISATVDDGFVLRYRNEGSSVRGSLEDILDELSSYGKSVDVKESVLKTIREARQANAPQIKSTARRKSGLDL